MNNCFFYQLGITLTMSSDALCHSGRCTKVAPQEFYVAVVHSQMFRYESEKGVLISA